MSVVGTHPDRSAGEWATVALPDPPAGGPVAVVLLFAAGGLFQVENRLVTEITPGQNGHLN